MSAAVRPFPNVPLRKVLDTSEVGVLLYNVRAAATALGVERDAFYAEMLHKYATPNLRYLDRTTFCEAVLYLQKVQRDTLDI